MSTYRVTGVAKENGTPVSALIVVYKADRNSIGTAGQELGRGLSNSIGNFEITFNDWSENIFVVALDLTPTPSTYNGVIVDWIVGEYVGNDPEYDKVQLLMHMEGADGGIFFEDETGKSFTRLGAATTSVTQAKFGGTSLKLTGADLIETPADPSLNISTFDFCLEAWVFQTDSTGPQVIFDGRTYGGGYCPILVRVDSGVPTMWMSANGTSWFISTLTGPNLPINTWSHIAAVRYNSGIRLYVNGVGGSTITDGRAISSQQYAMTIGGDIGLTQAFFGYIDEVRFTVGSGRYDSNFFPPTIPFPSGGDQYFQNVKSLMHFNGADGGTIFSDEIQGNVVNVGSGTPTTSTSEFKFGSSSLLLDGNSTLELAYNSKMDVQYADFTYECWSFTTAPKSTTYRYLVDKRIANSGYAAFIIRIYNGYFQVYVRNGTSSWASTNTAANTVLINQWQHIALTRSDGKVRFFIDGEKVWEANHTTPIIADTNPFEIGKSWVGNIDDVRLSVGVARYLATFPVPSKEFDNQ